MAGNGWYGLLSIMRERAEIKRARESTPPSACPNDGEPLQPASGGRLICPFDQWEWPRDSATAIR